MPMPRGSPTIEVGTIGPTVIGVPVPTGQLTNPSELGVIGLDGRALNPLPGWQEPRQTNDSPNALWSPAYRDQLNTIERDCPEPNI